MSSFNSKYIFQDILYLFGTFNISSLFKNNGFSIRTKFDEKLINVFHKIIRAANVKMLVEIVDGINKKCTVNSAVNITNHVFAGKYFYKIIAKQDVQFPFHHHISGRLFE